MKQFVGPNGLTYLMTLIKDALKTKVETTDSRLSDARTPLKHASTHEKGGTDEINLTSYGVLYKADVVNNLNSTDTDKPLSANQGKVLAEKIANAGYGDMMASTYDTNGNGKVDDAEKVGGKTYTEIETMAGDKATAVQTAINNKIGQPSGLAPLDSNGKIDAQYLPGYVDDVIEGYYHNNSFYVDSAHASLITPEKDKLYVDVDTNKVYRWTGSTYVAVSGTDDLVEMTNAEILDAWNTTFGTNE